VECRIFKKDADFNAFERILAEGLERYPCRILAYQLMSNHWHFLLQPAEDGAMSLCFPQTTYADVSPRNAHVFNRSNQISQAQQPHLRG
jgi:putative transposase